MNTAHQPAHPTRGTLVLALLLLVIVAVSGCGRNQARPGGTVSVITPDFFGIGENLAIQLKTNLVTAGAENTSVIMTTFVNIDNLYQASRFGRTLTESLATRLFRHGFGVVEVRKSTDLLIKNDTGELILTRDASLIAKQYPASGLVVGTYSLTPNSVIVNVRLLDCASQEVMSVAGMEIQRTRNIDFLLAGARGLADAQLSAYE